MIDETASTCALCSIPVHQHPIVEGNNRFCCTGCHAVFNILSAKNALSDFSTHPIFLQALKTGVISNPALLEKIRSRQVEVADHEKQRLYLEIGNMWCPFCAEVIKLSLNSMQGVVNCVVDYTTDLASIEYSPRHVAKDSIVQMISSFGYEVKDLDSKGNKAVSFDLYLRFVVAAFCSLNVMMFAYPLYATYFSYDGEGYGELFAWLSLVASLPVVLYSGFPIWQRCYHALRVGLLGMEALVTLGVASAFIFSIFELMQGGTRVYFDSMTVVVVFVLLGKIIESKAKFSAKESLLRLSRSTPRRGRKVMPDGSMEFVLVKEAEKGDLFAAFVGERIVLDGVVVSGSGACDESLMTGESMPVTKKLGDDVLAGTVVVQGSLQYRVKSSEEETALQKIIEMVEHDIGHKSIYSRAADRIVTWFVPLVIALAVLCGVVYYAMAPLSDAHPGETALLRALAVLLISCPCAIGIAAPTAESYLLNRLASIGVIVRNRGALEQLGRESVMIFDKTGTVTEGSYKVHSGLEKLEKGDVLAIHSITRNSSHPVAIALSTASDVGGILPVNNVEEHIGNGITGQVDGNDYLIGSKRFCESKSIDVNHFDSNSGVYVAKNGVCIACVELGDNIRAGLSEIIKKLAPLRCILLSGDRESVVNKVATETGFNGFKGECTPLEKRDYVEKLRSNGEVVAMVGDGINDAPALTAANIGISVVSATDMSIQVSDLLLTTSNLDVIANARSLAAQGRRIVRQNMFWAFLYNVIGIGLAAFGLLTPVFAAAAMSISSLTVLLNARRLNHD